jgi:hypothetical protein
MMMSTVGLGASLPRSEAFCSAMLIASAPATKRRGGCSWPAMVSSAWASLAALPPC